MGPRNVRCALALLFLVCAASTSVEGGVILNGDFSAAGTAPDPFAHWTTATEFLFEPPTDGGGHAVFAEGGEFSGIQIQQTFVVPSNALTLAFEFKMDAVAEGSSGSPVPGSFQATLFNSDFAGLFPSDPSNADFFPAFYSIDPDGSDFFDPGFVTRLDLGNGFRRITLNLSSLSPQTVTIDFLLNGMSDGYLTTIFLDDVVLIQADTDVIPEPATGTMILTALAYLYGIRRIGTWNRQRRTC